MPIAPHIPSVTSPRAFNSRLLHLLLLLLLIKVFLNPGLVVDKTAAIKKVVDAWSKQRWFGEAAIAKKFEKYLDIDIENASDLEIALRQKTTWFDEIFKQY